MEISTFGDELGLTLHPRPAKPRASGLCMVIDTGQSLPLVDGILGAYGHLIDIVKLTELHLRMDAGALREKIARYQEHDVSVQPGGIVIEIARLQNRGDEVLEKLRETGFDTIEISSSATTARGQEEERAFVERTRALGFRVMGEVGKKFHEGDSTRKSDTELDIDETVRQMRVLLDAGADKVYWEGHVLRRIMGDTASDMLLRRDSGTVQVHEVIDRIGTERVIFEVSSMIPYTHRRAQQFWLVRNFGPEVNVGNVRIDEVQFLEQVRLGTWPVFGFGPIGDHPYMQSLERHGGVAGEHWWQEIPIEAGA